MLERVLLVGLFCHLASVTMSADLAYDRVVEAARTSFILPADLVESARDACSTALCFAQSLAEALPEKIRLEPVAHPDTDSIRWVKTPASVSLEKTGDTRTLRITRFGRKAVSELRAASASGSVPVDLRGHRGGDVERMLQIAGLLIGPRRNAVEIDHGDRIECRSLDGPKLPGLRVTRVLIDDETASAALLLARLLTIAGDAELVGADRGEAIFLKRRIAIDHDWRLVLPMAELRIADGLPQ